MVYRIDGFKELSDFLGSMIWRFKIFDINRPWGQSIFSRRLLKRL
jgi:hypothetical protein